MNQTTVSLVARAESKTATQRLASLDALRGFDMFWIVGADGLVNGLHQLTGAAPIRFLSIQLQHEQWQGFHFEDLIFPLFVFMVGISLVFSLTRLVQQTGRGAAVRRIVRRAVLLYLLGLFYYGGFSGHLQHVRLLGVLQRIALCYLFGALLFCFLRPKALVGVCVGLLAGYWALMTFVPVPQAGPGQQPEAGNFAEGKNLANYLDKMYLPLRKWDGDHDPEGLLSTLPAIATCLLGVFAGLLVKEKKVPDQKKVFYLVGAGGAAVALGWLWGFQFPVIKKLWTSSYVLVAGGCSALLLAWFYQVIEVWRWRRWAQPFVWVGMNPITIYLAVNVIDFDGLAGRFVGGDLNHALGRYGALVLALASLALVFGLAGFLHRRKIFIRL